MGVGDSIRHESGQTYRVIRSARRTRTIQSRIMDGVVEIRIPARLSRAQEAAAVEEMLAKRGQPSTCPDVFSVDLSQ